jgi:catechol-2,3-dioxygenase
VNTPNDRHFAATVATPQKGTFDERAVPADSELTHILVVADADRSRDFYRDVLGAKVRRRYGGTRVAVSVTGTWLLLVTGGEPTPDKQH